MPNYRKIISHDLISSLEHDDTDHITSVDRVTAFSFSPRLGTLLWRIKYALDPSSVKPATFLLAKRLEHTERSLAIKIAKQCIREWILPMCPVCNGAQHIKQDELVIICSECRGSGLIKWDDHARSKELGIAADKFAKQFKIIHDSIGAWDRTTNVVMAEKMLD